LSSQNSASVSYASFFKGTFSVSGVDFIVSLDSISSIGVSAGYVLIPDILITENWQVQDSLPVVPSEDKLVYESSSRIAFRFSYGRAFSTPFGRLSAGFAVNTWRQRLLDVMGFGGSIDGGLTLHIPALRFTSSLLAENILGNATYWGDDFFTASFPQLRVSLGYVYPVEYLYGKFNLYYTSLDFTANEGVNYSGQDQDGDANADQLAITDGFSFFKAGKFGLEYTVNDNLAFRLGTTGFERWHFGAGVHLFENTAGVDFAYVTNELSGSYTGTLRYLF